MDSVKLPTIQTLMEDYLTPMSELGIETDVGVPRWHPYERTWVFPVSVRAKEADAPRE
jgi:hypothetical protein